MILGTNAAITTQIRLERDGRICHGFAASCIQWRNHRGNPRELIPYFLGPTGIQTAGKCIDSIMNFQNFLAGFLPHNPALHRD